MTIKIEVKMLTGKKLILDVNSSDTEVEVKSLIQAREGIPPDQQRLIFEGEQLGPGNVVYSDHRIRIVDGPSGRLPPSSKDHFDINLDQPFFLFYHKVFRGDPSSGGTADQNCANLSHDSQSVDVGGVTIQFHRTVRVPDNGKTHALPPNLGAFRLFNMGEFTDKLPPSILSKGGAFIGMYQREAMWISLLPDPSGHCYAVKVSVGGINALTGLPLNEPCEDKQDYLAVCPNGQPWLDGICTVPGIIRQLVAMPLGSGYTVEGQLTGREQCGGLQIDVFPQYDFTCLNNIISLTGWKPGQDAHKFRTPRQAGFVRGDLLTMRTAQRVPLSHSKMLSEYGIKDGSTLNLVLRLRGGWRPEVPIYQGFGAGGSIVQKIYRDQHPPFTYNMQSRTSFTLTVINAAHFTSVTGLPSPPSPISAQTYLSVNLPWYSLYDEHIPTADNTRGLFRLGTVQSVATVMHTHQSTQRDEDEGRKECGYCSYRLAEIRMQPCGHVFCASCCNATRCPSCQVQVTGHMQFAAPMAAPGQEADDGVEAMSLDRRIVMLQQGARMGQVHSFRESTDAISPLCGFANLAD